MFFLAELIDTAFRVYSYILIARILLSWVQPNPYNPVVRWIVRVTEPVLAPARRIIPPIGMVDISPIIVFFILDLLRRWLLRLVMAIAIGM
jgi:YggT family protein